MRRKTLHCEGAGNPDDSAILVGVVVTPIGTFRGLGVGIQRDPLTVHGS